MKAFLFFILFIFLTITLQKKIAPNSNDLAEKYFNAPFSKNIYNLPKSGSSSRPWSGSYWPDTKGGIGVRYQPTEGGWLSQPSDHKRKYGAPGFQEYVRDNYSPAEKYDLLVGDTDYTLTNMVRARTGRAGGWEGICHGWSPASFMEYRPRWSVTLLAADGVTNITFLPDDIKGLISQFYASSIDNYKTIFIGSLCPLFIKDYKLIQTMPQCYDNNPATFLLITANQIGLNHRSMIFDQQADPQIWNFPAFSYKITYWNPITQENSPLIDGAKIPISQARISGGLASFGAANADKSAQYIIGADLEITYAIEIEPNRPNPLPDDEDSKTYKMIIELDKDNNIVGGSWINNTHPDFIWKIDLRYPINKDKADTVSFFGGSSADLRQMTPIAKKLSLKKQVIYAVVSYLVYNSS